MSTQNEIINTITEAFNALENRPKLEAEIKKLRDELDLAKYEIECRVADEAKLNQKISDLHESRADLRLQLDEANEQLHDARNTIHINEATIRQQGHRIHELEVDLNAKQILEGCLRDDKAALERELTDSQTSASRFREMLSKIMGEVKELLPVPEVTNLATFPESPVEHINVDTRSLVETDRVVDEVKHEHKPLAEQAKEIASLWGF